MKWIDKREVFLLTNCDFGPENITNNWKNDKIIKPYPICHYNKNKGSVDFCNKYTSYYANEHRTYKWWYRIFLALMDMSLFNAFVIWSQKIPLLQKKDILTFLLMCANSYSIKNKLFRLRSLTLVIE